VKSDEAKAEKLEGRDLTHIVELHSWLRIVGDRHHTLALIPTGISKQGYARLAEFCRKMSL
jgi:hypothetical protein